MLLWEDDTQKDKDNNNRYDVYMAFLDNTGQPDRLPRDPTDPPMPDPGARPPRQLLRISDTPKNTAGQYAIATPTRTAAAISSTAARGQCLRRRARIGPEG